MTKKCERCPVADGLECLGTTPRFPHFCEWALTDDIAKRMLIADRSKLPVEPLPTPPTLPPLWRQAANLAGAVVSEVIHVAAGGDIAVDDAAYEARLAVCRGTQDTPKCDHHMDGDRCGDVGEERGCGCHLMAKAKLAGMHCPLRKWAGD